MSADAKRRATDFQYQGDNSYVTDGYTHTCMLTSTAGVLKEAGVEVDDRPIRQDDVIAAAKDAHPPLCNTAGRGDGTERGHAGLNESRDLMAEHGVTAETYEAMKATDLVDHLDQDKGVIAVVDSGALWSQHTQAAGGRADHAVWLTGVVRDRSGEVRGFMMNDSGSRDGGGNVVSVAHFERSFELRNDAGVLIGGEALVTKETFSVLRGARR